MVLPTDAEKTLSRGTALLNALRAKTNALPKAPKPAAQPARVVPSSASVATGPTTNTHGCGHHGPCVELDDDLHGIAPSPGKQPNSKGSSTLGTQGAATSAAATPAIPRAAAISVKARVFASRPPQLATADDSEFVPKKRRLDAMPPIPTAEVREFDRSRVHFRSLEKAPGIALGNGAAVHRRGGRAAAAVAAAHAMEWGDRTAEEQMLSLVQLKWPDQLSHEENFVLDLLAPSLWSAPKPSIGHQIIRVIKEKKIGAKRLCKWCLVVSSVHRRAKQDHERARACCSC
jgi:hypothetical protein